MKRRDGRGKIRVNGLLVLFPNIKDYFGQLIIKGVYQAKEEVEIVSPKHFPHFRTFGSLKMNEPK